MINADAVIEKKSIVDVFAEEKYAGNQLAVVRDAAGLSDSDMQNITKEMNYSETTFILSDDFARAIRTFFCWTVKRSH